MQTPSAGRARRARQGMKQMHRLLVLLLMLAAIVATGPALAQPAEPSPQQLRELAELLRDPAIQTWLQAQAEGGPAAVAEPPAAPEPTAPDDGRRPRRHDARVPASARGGDSDAARTSSARPGDKLYVETPGAGPPQHGPAARRLSPPSALASNGCSGGRRPEFATRLIATALDTSAGAAARGRRTDLPTASAWCSRSPSAASAASCCSSGRRCCGRSCSPISWSS